MSNMVRYTNDSMESALHTLHATEMQKFNMMDNLEQSEIINIDRVDPKILLY